MDISIGEAHNRLSAVLKQVEKGPVRITHRGKAVGVIISAEEYEHLQRVSAYIQMTNLAKSLEQSGVRAAELYQASRRELEDKP